MVLVIACPFQLHRLVVQEKTLLGIEPYGANAERGRVTIDDIASGLHLRHQRVEVSLLEGPEPRLLDRDLLLPSVLTAFWDGDRVCTCLAHFLAQGIQD